MCSGSPSFVLMGRCLGKKKKKVQKLHPNTFVRIQHLSCFDVVESLPGGVLQADCSRLTLDQFSQ